MNLSAKGTLALLGKQLAYSQHAPETLYVTAQQHQAVVKSRQKHPAFPQGGLRHRIFHANENGLEESGALIRNGGRVLLHEEKFFDWVMGRRVA